jgi:hypothetical protein
MRVHFERHSVSVAVAHLILVRRLLALCMKQTVNLNNYGNQDLNYPTR